jgi:hypothetical protein
MYSVAVLRSRAQIAEIAAWLATFLTVASILLLVSLHILSPEFAPSWRMISEYAFGRHGGVLSLMFLCMGASPWALAVAIGPDVSTRAGKIRMWFLIIAGLGGVMASVFDVTYETGHMIAGLLGVLGFPIGALLLSVSLGRNEMWRGARQGMLWLANLTWVSIMLLVVTLAIMTMQMFAITGGHLPQHAPKELPPGVFALDGWADRLVVLSTCAWVLFAARGKIAACRKQARRITHDGQDSPQKRRYMFVMLQISPCV